MQILLVFSKDIAINNNLLRLNHSGSAFADSDAYIYFASDSYLFWDESVDWLISAKTLHSDQFLHASKGRSATVDYKSTSAVTEGDVYTALKRLFSRRD